MSWAAIAVGVVGIGVGVVERSSAKKKQAAAEKKILPYKTPQEVYDVLNATKYNAQSGFDPETLNYLTNQTDNAFAGSLGNVQRLGGDPNAMSAIFNQKVNAISGIAAQDHQLQMQNFSAYINALNAVGSNDAAEQKSIQDQLKDRLQQIAIDKQVATQQISQGINSAISGAAMYGAGQLYNTPNQGNSNSYFQPLGSPTTRPRTGLGYTPVDERLPI